MFYVPFLLPAISAVRIVIDTNLLISHIFWPNSPLREHVALLLRHCDVLRSTESFAELSEVIMRRKFDSYLPTVERELFLAGFYDTTYHVIIHQRITACRDPKDNKFLELAINGNAELLITGDKDLLALNPFEGLRILSLKDLA